MEMGSTSGVKASRTSRNFSDTAPYASMRGGTTTACGHSRSASAIGIALRQPNGRASYDAASTTPRRREPPTMTGLPRSAGLSRCSTDA